MTPGRSPRQPGTWPTLARPMRRVNCWPAPKRWAPSVARCRCGRRRPWPGWVTSSRRASGWKRPVRRASTPVASAPRPSCADWRTGRWPPGGAKHVGTSARTTGAPAPDPPEVAMRQIPLLPALSLGLSLLVLLSACATCPEYIQVTYAADETPVVTPDSCKVEVGTTITWRGPESNDTPFTLTFRSEEHTSELQSLMRISYDVLCLKKTQII